VDAESAALAVTCFTLIIGALTISGFDLNLIRLIKEIISEFKKRE